LLAPIPKPAKEKALVVGTQGLPHSLCSALSHDGKRIAVGMENGAVVFWDTIAGRPTRTLAAHQKGVSALLFSPDDRRLLTASADGTAALWETDSGAPVRVFKGHSAAVTSAAFSPDAQRIVTGSADKTAIVWDA